MLPAPPLFILFFHFFSNIQERHFPRDTERLTGSTPFHSLVSYVQQRHFHREGYRLHPFSSSCFISSKTTFSRRGSSCFISSKTAFSPGGLPAPPLFILLFYLFSKHRIFTQRVTGSTPFHPLVLNLEKTTFSPRRLPTPPLFSLLFHIFKNDIFTERVTGSNPFHPHVSFLQKRHFHGEDYRLHPFSFSCFISSKTTFSPRVLPAPPLFILFFHFFSNIQKRHFPRDTERVTSSTPFHPHVSFLQKQHFHREGYRLHPFSSSCFISSKTTFSPRGLPALPLFILLFHIFKNDVFTQRVTGSTPFHPLVSYVQQRHFHREGYRLHPFSSSCFISSKTTFSRRGSSCFISSKTAFAPGGLPAPPLFILLFHIFKKAHFHPKGYRLHPFSSSCFKTSKNDIFTETVTDSTPFQPLVSYLQKRHFHREGYRLQPFSSSCFISSKTTFSRRGLPAPPLFILLFHILKNNVFTERVTGSIPFHPLVSFLQKRHLHREGYRPHPFSSSCFISSKRHFHREGCWLHPFSSSCLKSPKTAFSPRGLPAPPLFILLLHIFQNDIFTQSVTGSTPFHPHVSFLQKGRFHREGYRLHPFSSSCFISSTTAFSSRRLPTPPLFRLLFHIFKNDIFTERVAGSTPFHSPVSYLQKHSKTAFSPSGLPAPPPFILLFHIFNNGIFTQRVTFSSSCFTERVTGSTPFHRLVSYLQKRHFHREGYRLYPFSSSCFISSKTTFSPRGLPAPPLFILLFHIFKNDVFTERVTGSSPFHPLVSPRVLPAPSPCFISSKTFKNGTFTERVTGSTPFHPFVSYLHKRHFHRDGYPLRPFSSSCFISSKSAFSPRGLRAPPLFILLFHIFKNGIFTERVTGSNSFPPFVSYLQKRHFHRDGYRLHPFSSSCFISSKTTFSPRGLYRLHPFSSSCFISCKTTLSPRGLPAPPLFILLLHSFKNDVFTERVTASTPFHPLVSYLQKRHFLREGYRLHPFSSSCFISSKTAFSHREGYRLHPFSSSSFISSTTACSLRGLPAPPLFILLFHILQNDAFTERVTDSTPFHPLVSYLQKRHFHTERVTGCIPFRPLLACLAWSLCSILKIT